MGDEQDLPALLWTWEKTDADLIREIEAMGGAYVLHVQCEKFDLPLVYRRCKAQPTKDQAALVATLSGGQTGVRAFSGESFPDGPCKASFYLGWNTRGFGLDMRSCYCQICGYAFTDIAKAARVIVDPATVSGRYLEECRRKCEKTEIEFQAAVHPSA